MSFTTISRAHARRLWLWDKVRWGRSRIFTYSKCWWFWSRRYIFLTDTFSPKFFTAGEADSFSFRIVRIMKRRVVAVVFAFLPILPLHFSDVSLSNTCWTAVLERFTRAAILRCQRFNFESAKTTDFSSFDSWLPCPMLCVLYVRIIVRGASYQRKHPLKNDGLLHNTGTAWLFCPVLQCGACHNWSQNAIFVFWIPSCLVCLTFCAVECFITRRTQENAQKVAGRSHWEATGESN